MRFWACAGLRQGGLDLFEDARNRIICLTELIEKGGPGRLSQAAGKARPGWLGDSRPDYAPDCAGLITQRTPLQSCR